MANTDNHETAKPRNVALPMHEIESLARCLLPEIYKFFESDEGKREFAKWQATQTKNDESGK